MSETTQQYVLGFLYAPDRKTLVLIRKSKGPMGMAGKLNGVGGKFEPGEIGVDAMRREAREEIGVDLRWLFFGTMRGAGWIVFLYLAMDLRAETVEALEDEPIVRVDPMALPEDVMPNLRWLVPLSLDFGAVADVHYYAAASNQRPLA